MRKLFTSQQKASIALAAVKGQQTINQLSSAHEVHPTQVNSWKKILLSEASSLFADKRKKNNSDTEQLLNQLYQIIGQRDLELSWLKKKLEPFNSSG